MKNLREAWQWYETVAGQVNLMQRLALKHWDQLPWDAALGRDDRFRLLVQEQVISDSALALEPLNDLAVVVLFSVFESLVRQHVYDDVNTESKKLLHPALQLAARDALQRIDEGSFFRVLEPFKRMDADLIEQVNQIRGYRNWVAHGRRGDRPSLLEPRAAFDRLERFLVLLGLSEEDEEGVEGTA